MDNLILHPTDMSQWHALINEAQVTIDTSLDEQTESYLVFLLMRYAAGPKLIDSFVGIDFLNSMEKSGEEQISMLRDVGDKSLIFSGLFPGIIQRRRVSVNYYIDMGQAAYHTIGTLTLSPDSELYSNLCKQFIDLQKTLQAIRGDVCEISERQ